MKYLNSFSRFSRVLTITLLAGISPVVIRAEDSTNSPTLAAERMFATPDEALQALQKAAATKDPLAMSEIFGPEYPKLLTGDRLQDAKNAEHFAEAMAQGCRTVTEGESNVTFEIGTNHWPLPVPLVKADGQWHFDTAAGREEIINRHVGKDELHAIGVCRAYVVAQHHYALATAPMGGETKYARKFMSATGTKDGLYWPANGSEPASPFGPLVAAAQTGNYPGNNDSRPEPFHGYYFKILTRQGAAAPGGEMNYISHGDFTGGFALVAYPEQWDKSGVMTFIVSQDGQVWQHNFGASTPKAAAALREYNPGPDWTLVTDQGVLAAASEK